MKEEIKHYTCPYIEDELIDYYNEEGLKFPCCFLIKEEKSLSREEIKEMFFKRNIPKGYEGCQFLTKGERTFYENSLKGRIKKLKNKIKKLLNRFY